MIAALSLSPKRGNKLIASLSLNSEHHNILHISLSRTNLSAGTLIFSRNINAVLFIENGIVSPTIITEEGETLGIGPIGWEGVVGLPGIGGSYGFHVRVLTKVEALQISPQALEMACSRSKELEMILRQYSDEVISDSIRRLACHYHHELERRLPRWLLMATERARSHSLTITQELIAEAHGVSVNAISITLKEIEKRGGIQQSRGKITVVNSGKLRSAACRCHQENKRGKNILSKGRSI